VRVNRPCVRIDIQLKPINHDLLTAYLRFIHKLSTPTSLGDRDRDGTHTAAVGLVYTQTC
jgi:hypothetical protein